MVEKECKECGGALKPLIVVVANDRVVKVVDDDEVQNKA
jgi:hypothetical protein